MISSPPHNKKYYRLDMGWINTKNGGRFQQVPKEVLEEAEKYALDQLEGDEMMD